jgi:tetratricopeptide (TPR) repeat protein
MLTRLDAALAAARHPVDVACARAERAGYLARQGLLDSARVELALLRERFPGPAVALVTVWGCVVEAWIEYYDGRESAAVDKLQRAYALSAASKLQPLHALSAAWLAFLSYHRDDFPDMEKYLTVALRLADPQHHLTQARIAIIAAGGYHWANRLDLATPWYAKARDHALAESDDATLSVITFTMAAHRINHASRASIFGEEDSIEVRNAQAWLDASFSLDHRLGAAPKDAYGHIFRALLCSAQQQYSQALAAYEEHLDEADRQGALHMRAVHLADQAWCRFHTGHADGARADAVNAAALINPGMFIEDTAVASGRLDQVFSALGDTDAALHHRQVARDHWSRHLAMRRSLLDHMNGAIAAASVA